MHVDALMRLPLCDHCDQVFWTNLEELDLPFFHGDIGDVG